jgi:hypothetical protein
MNALFKQKVLKNEDKAKEYIMKISSKLAKMIN